MPSSNKDLKIYNSLTSTKDFFCPINENMVGMYVCGPTVYNTVHLGNIRTFISFDLIFRYLKHTGYNVRYVRNITDVGHLEDNSNEDKISKRAKIEKIEPMEVVQKYTNEFHSILDLFNVLKPSIEPTASGHIIDQIEMIQEIIDKGYAYESEGSVYFDTNAFNKDFKYSKLSKRDLDNVINESRGLTGGKEKRNLQDFALWKKAEDKHIMKWKSPWSLGFPGWHLECSAMSRKYLGNKFDIHGGGLDLKFPHHDCEIAQNECLTNEVSANFWLHANMLTLNGKKMSKSTGNSVLASEIFDGNNNIFSKSFSPMTLKFFMYQAHYRNTLDLSNEALLASEKAFDKVIQLKKDLANLETSNVSSISSQDWVNNCYKSLNDDFNSPKLIANFFDLIKIVSEIKSGKKKIDYENKDLLNNYFTVFSTDILGLNFESEKNDNTNKILDLLVQVRDKERENKNYVISDFIRNQLNSLGINIEDKK